MGQGQPMISCSFLELAIHEIYHLISLLWFEASIWSFVLWPSYAFCLDHPVILNVSSSGWLLFTHKASSRGSMFSLGAGIHAMANSVELGVILLRPWPSSRKFRLAGFCVCIRKPNEQKRPLKQRFGELDCSRRGFVDSMHGQCTAFTVEDVVEAGVCFSYLGGQLARRRPSSSYRAVLLRCVTPRWHFYIRSSQKLYVHSWAYYPKKSQILVIVPF